MYSDDGITKSDFKSNGLFDHSLTINNDSIIRLQSSLYNDKRFIVIEPKSWGGYKGKRLDTIINSRQFKIEIYSNDLSDKTRDSIFKKILSSI